jgi:hypothetical protein
MPTHNILFAAQFAISGSTLAFCMAMLWNGRDPGVYLPVVTGILGYWLPSPSSGRNANIDKLGTNNNTSTTSTTNNNYLPTQDATDDDVERPLL